MKATVHYCGECGAEPEWMVKLISKAGGGMYVDALRNTSAICLPCLWKLMTKEVLEVK
jgi:hypothetical protein